MLFITDPDNTPEPDVVVLQRAFALTAAEARVAAALAQGYSADVATRRRNAACAVRLAVDVSKHGLRRRTPVLAQREPKMRSC